jgi:hypothetical protein
MLKEAIMKEDGASIEFIDDEQHYSSAMITKSIKQE